SKDPQHDGIRWGCATAASPCDVTIRSHQHCAAGVEPVELCPVVLYVLEIGTSTDPDGLERNLEFIGRQSTHVAPVVRRGSREQREPALKEIERRRYADPPTLCGWRSAVARRSSPATGRIHTCGARETGPGHRHILL